ncbi:hypothetical protein PILCRDRAFT_826771 [Piloderma croceum F 1598]|uniref:Aminoglycoside phosphotransferase domain-containing protein n=1 Tax=Piloderma croceum (strain F 1598) TaxID=765440 RepID=A0A0C3F7P2_PILCF|nr:hypothetical protein PILCRDRAFT_826771 [Piloderma croceum F 1598]
MEVDWIGVHDPWVGVNPDMGAMRRIVCETFRISDCDCGPAIPVGDSRYARVYSFSLPGSRSVIARLVAPIKPLFKTEVEPLPVPKVFVYSSEANPVGVEWVLMEHMPGVELCEAWKELDYDMKARFVGDLVDMYDQLSQLKADSCGAIYHSTRRSMDLFYLPLSSTYAIRSPRWKPLSSMSLQSLRAHCHHPLCDSDNFYEIGPIQDCAVLRYALVVPPPSQAPPVFTTVDYVRLLAYNGCPSTRSAHDEPTRDKVVKLFESLHALYSRHPLFGPRADPFIFRFCHGDLHDGNILIDPTTGKITGIIDWECAGFRPWWTDVAGVGWLDEDRERFLFGANRPNKFSNDKSNSLNSRSDGYLRALFRTELHKRNPDLFSCFIGGVEMRAMLHAATDMPMPVGESRVFLTTYEEIGCWNRSRRGPFPFDMMAWRHTRITLDEMARIAKTQKAETVVLHT